VLLLNKTPKVEETPTGVDEDTTVTAEVALVLEIEGIGALVRT